MGTQSTWGFSDCANMEDYYTTLGLTKSASIADVTSSFRKLALKHHPDRNPEDQLASKAKLDQICESYDVLSNPMYRAVFDQHGKRGLNSAVADGKGGNVKPSHFHRACN